MTSTSTVRATFSACNDGTKSVVIEGEEYLQATGVDNWYNNNMTEIANLKTQLRETNNSNSTALIAKCIVVFLLASVIAITVAMLTRPDFNQLVNHFFTKTLPGADHLHRFIYAGLPALGLGMLIVTPFIINYFVNQRNSQTNSAKSVGESKI